MATITKRTNGKWQAKCRRKGYQAQSKTFRTKSDAERWARQVENEMDKGVFESSSEAEITLMSNVFEQYWLEVVQFKKSADMMLYSMNKMKKIFGHLRLIDVSVEIIRDYKSYRLETVGGDTVRKELLLIKRMIRYAMDEWQIHLPKGNPLDVVSLPVKGNSRDRRLEAGEEENLLATAKNYGGSIYDIIILAIESGMRRGEMIDMKWNNFNQLHSTIYLEDTKNGDSRTVPLSPGAIDVITRQIKTSSPFIFNIRGDSVGQAFRRITKRTGINNLRFHDLRHEATSRFFEMGLQLMEVSLITGHKDLAMLKRYTHLRPTDIAKKLRK